MKKVQEQLDQYERSTNTHNGQAKTFIEGAVRWFLNQEIATLGLRAGTCYHEGDSYEWDVVVTNQSDGEWDLDAVGVRLKGDTKALAHLQIQYRGERATDPPSKLASEYRRLLSRARADAAILGGYPVTALVCFGPGWARYVDRIPTIVHEVVHDEDLHAVELGGRTWYPLVDSIVVPGMHWKKHDLFREYHDVNSGHAAYMGTRFQGDATGVRPLAIARGFAIHKLALLKRLAVTDHEDRAWPEEMDSALLGPYPEYAAPVNHLSEVSSAFCAGDVLDERIVLWHRGWNRRSVNWEPIQYRRTECVCSKGSGFRLKPA